MKIDQFINKYQVSKTLRFKLIPQGKTLKYMCENGILGTDELLSNEKEKVKKYMNEYHKHFIHRILSNVKLENIREFADVYYSTDTEKLSELKNNYIKQIENAFTSDSEYKKLFGKEIITEILPKYYENNKDAIDTISKFSKYTTYFTGFFENRKNIYALDDKTDKKKKSTEIAYRLIEDNLGRFLNNCKSKDVIQHELSEKLLVVNNEIGIKFKYDISKIFDFDSYNDFLTQEGIDLYNQIVGGYSTDNGEKIKGINEYINEYNQTNDIKISKLKPLYKQVLSDRTTLSFIPEKYKCAAELTESINSFWNVGANGENCGFEAARQLISVITDLKKYNSEKVYIDSHMITDISNGIFNDWSSILDKLHERYDVNFTGNKNTKKYEEEKKKYFKNKKFYSLSEIISLFDNDDIFYDYFKTKAGNLIKNAESAYEQFLKVDFANIKSLKQNEDDISLIKIFLDSIKELKKFISVFYYCDENNYDCDFYNLYYANFDCLEKIDLLYNKCRNYLTQKPFSTNKIKINFNNSQLLAGWDENKEEDDFGVILRKDGKYFLGILNKDYKKVFEEFPCDGDCYEKMVYKLLPGPNKTLPHVVFANSNKELFNIPDEILDIRKKESFKTGNNFNIEDCHKFIDFYKSCLPIYDSWRIYDFKFRDTKDYKNIGEFFNEVADQGYKVLFKNISKKYIDDLVENGKLYLFQIYNKDFSSYSKGNKNLHTMIFESAFTDYNLKNNIVALNGGAEIFFRKSSIDPSYITHPKNVVIKNKTAKYRNGAKEESVFEYDLIKNKRYAYDQFMLHVPMLINKKAKGNDRIDFDVRNAIKNCENNNIIGIDRGERNLLYISVIDENGKILEQFSTNIMKSDKNVPMDYHKMLEDRQEERNKQKQSWQSINAIKDFKSGYLSYVIKVIYDLIIKYDAIVVMEDLNKGFKNVRSGIDTQVYREFEKALTDKLNLVIQKNKKFEENGSVYNAYQLTGKYNSDVKQSGFLIYVPSWNTSKIDPVTGFVDLIKPKYKSVESSKSLINAFEFIRYNKKDDLFEFGTDLTKFDCYSSPSVSNWCICSYGDRIKTSRNKEGYFVSEKLNVTNEIKKLFDKYEIRYSDMEDLKNQILRNDAKEFYIEFIKLIALMLQLRNSDSATREDYIISPVKNNMGLFFDSRNYSKDSNPEYPIDADANGAYNIARKGLLFVKKIKNTDNVKDASPFISNSEWLDFVQKNGISNNNI